MKISAKIHSGGVREETIDICTGSTYEDMLGYLQINPEIVIVFRNGNPVPLDEKVSQESVDIIRVVTGG